MRDESGRMFFFFFFFASWLFSIAPTFSVPSLLVFFVSYGFLVFFPSGAGQLDDTMMTFRHTSLIREGI